MGLRQHGLNHKDIAERHTDNQPVPGVVIFRCEGSLVYFNIDHIHDAVLARVRKENAVKHVVCDLSASPLIDLAGADMLKALELELRAMNIQLHVVEARSSVRDKLRTEGLEDRLGKRIDRFTTVADLVDSCVSDEPAQSASDGRG